MSIYSGFATRALETAYNRGICQLINMFQAHLLASLHNGNKDIEKINLQALTKSFNKIFNNLKYLEQQKHLEPKFSYYCKDLALYLGYDDSVKINQDYPSRTSIHSDFDFHILNDVMAFDNSRQTPVKLMKRRMAPMADAKPVRKVLESTRRVSRNSFSSEKPPRATSTRTTPNIREIGSTRSHHSASKQRKFRKIDPAQLYHDQAIELLYSTIGD